MKLASGFCVGIIRPWMATVRYRIDTQGQLIEPWDPNVRERFIYCLWHDSLVFATALRSVAPVTALISPSNDGDLLAMVCRSFGVNPVRGSSSRGGIGALDKIIANKDRTHLLIAPDGPRGPRHRVKKGLIYLASRTGMAIVPVGVGFQRAWRTKTWDRMALPLPGSKMSCVIGSLIRVPTDIGKGDIEPFRIRLQQSMIAAADVACAWASGTRSSPERAVDRCMVKPDAF
jgi:hypothetical protein